MLFGNNSIKKIILNFFLLLTTNQIEAGPTHSKPSAAAVAAEEKRVHIAKKAKVYKLLTEATARTAHSSMAIDVETWVAQKAVAEHVTYVDTDAIFQAAKGVSRTRIELWYAIASNPLEALLTNPTELLSNANIDGFQTAAAAGAAAAPDQKILDWAQIIRSISATSRFGVNLKDIINGRQTAAGAGAAGAPDQKMLDRMKQTIRSLFARFSANPKDTIDILNTYHMRSVVAASLLSLVTSEDIVHIISTVDWRTLLDNPSKILLSRLYICGIGTYTDSRLRSSAPTPEHSEFMAKLSPPVAAGSGSASTVAPTPEEDAERALWAWVEAGAGSASAAAAASAASVPFAKGIAIASEAGGMDDPVAAAPSSLSMVGDRVARGTTDRTGAVTTVAAHGAAAAPRQDDADAAFERDLAAAMVASLAVLAAPTAVARGISTTDPTANPTRAYRGVLPPAVEAALAGGGLGEYISMAPAAGPGSLGYHALVAGSCEYVSRSGVSPRGLEGDTTPRGSISSSVGIAGTVVSVDTVLVALRAFGASGSIAAAPTPGTTLESVPAVSASGGRILPDVSERDLI